MIIGNFILLNLFVSVINEGLAFIKENPDEAEFDEALSSYVQVSKHRHRRKCRQRYRHGQP